VLLQGVKAVVYDSKAKQIVGRGAQPWGILESNIPGRAEQHPKTWIEVSSSSSSSSGVTAATSQRK
jgi:sugar (pentulose or hexulose) kinase